MYGGGCSIIIEGSVLLQAKIIIFANLPLYDEVIASEVAIIYTIEFNDTVDRDIFVGKIFHL